MELQTIEAIIIRWPVTQLPMVQVLLLHPNAVELQAEIVEKRDELLTARLLHALVKESPKGTVRGEPAVRIEFISLLIVPPTALGALCAIG